MTVLTGDCRPRPNTDDVRHFDERSRWKTARPILAMVLGLASGPALAEPAPGGSTSTPPESATAARGAAPTIGEVVVTPPKRYVEPEWSKHFNFDPHGRFPHSDTSRFQRPPEDGCTPMAGGSGSALAQGGPTSRIMCVRRF